VSHSVDEQYDVYKESRRKARKPHGCHACGETIRNGDSYTVASIVFDGSARSVKRCARCQVLHEHLRELGAMYDMWPNERLACGILYEDEWGRVPDDVARLAFALPGETACRVVTDGGHPLR